MAHDLIIENDKRRVTVHTLSCKVFSTIDRQFQYGHTVTVEEGWEVRKCVVCMPKVHVITVERGHVQSEGSKAASEIVNNYYANQPRPTWSESRKQKQDELDRTREIADRWHLAWHTNFHGGTMAIDELDISPSHSVNDNWMDDANCRGTGRMGRWLDWLFHSDSSRKWVVTIQREICMGCTVRAECLEQGVWGLEAFGIWGGATLTERKQLRRQWEREGRVDVRPYRPHSPGGRSAVSPGGDIQFPDGSVRRTNGSGVADQSRNVNGGVGEISGSDETAGSEVSGVRATWNMQGPGPDDYADDQWGGTGAGDW